MPQKICIIVTGPTAVGKTQIAINLALHFKTAIISADSRQCFKELDIGVAKPSPLQLQQVKHYFINSHSIAEDISAGVFETYALGAAEEIFKHNDIAIVAGGTGLYIKAFCEGMDAIPEVNEAVRNEIISQYQQNGIEWLQQNIKAKDPGWFATGEIQNPQRIMRALEVIEATGRSINDFKTGARIKRNFRIIKTGLQLPRQMLYENINSRVDEMITAGLEEEVKRLMPYRLLNALQTVGYKEFFDYFDGRINREQAIANIKTNTRHYAKRQLTWFTKDHEIIWFSPVDQNQLINYLHNLVKELH